LREGREAESQKGAENHERFLPSRSIYCGGIRTRRISGYVPKPEITGNFTIVMVIKASTVSILEKTPTIKSSFCQAFTKVASHKDRKRKALMGFPISIRGVVVSDPSPLIIKEIVHPEGVFGGIRVKKGSDSA
jgi:hypothetical protein